MFNRRIALTATVILLAVVSASWSREKAKPYTNSIGMRMLPIEAGSFEMGEKHPTPKRLGGPSFIDHGDWDERPSHRVTISRPFFISETPVTIEQYKQFRKEYTGLDIFDPYVSGVSWIEANAFCMWLSQKEGKNYRLPTEAEWEYAARAGTTTAYPWGDKLDHNYGNFGIEGPGLGGKAEGRDVWLAQTAPVASFPPNAFGLYDMHGNAFEWVEDCYNADLRELPADGSAHKQGNCNSRMFRSGSFISNPYMHRSGNRVRGYVPTTRGRNYMTIRVAKTLE